MRSSLDRCLTIRIDNQFTSSLIVFSPSLFFFLLNGDKFNLDSIHNLRILTNSIKIRVSTFLTSFSNKKDLDRLSVYEAT